LSAGPRFLVVQTAYLGDLVLTTPLVRELTRARPQAEITIVTTRLGPDVFEGLPGVRDVIVFDKRGSGLRGVLELSRRLRCGRHDAVLLAHRSHRSASLALLAGIGCRIGFAGAPGAWAYTATVPRDPTHHAVRRYLALSAHVGGDPEGADRAPRIGGLPHARAAARRLLEVCGLPPGTPFVALAPGSVWPTKRWTPEGFAAVARSIRARGVEPLLVGAEDDVAACRAVATALPGGIRSLAGRTTVAELAAVLERAVALVGNDSGATHVAAAVGTPAVAVFGPTVPALGFAPVGDEHAIVERRDLACRPCSRHGGRRCPLGHFRCMREIDGERVLEALRPMLERRGASAPAEIAS